MCCAWLFASPCKHIGACKTPMAGMVIGHSKPGLLMAAVPCSNSMIELLPRCNATQHSTCIGKLVSASCPFQISRQQDVLVGQQRHPLWGLSLQPQRQGPCALPTELGGLLTPIWVFARLRSLHHCHWPCGPMDKASAYGAGDGRLESCRGHFIPAHSGMGCTSRWTSG